MNEGQRSYQEWRNSLMADSVFRVVYEEEAAKKEVWLQCGEARQQASQPQKQNPEPPVEPATTT